MKSRKVNENQTEKARRGERSGIIADVTGMTGEGPRQRERGQRTRGVGTKEEGEANIEGK